jgi:hypothetical protein
MAHDANAIPSLSRETLKNWITPPQPGLWLDSGINAASVASSPVVGVSK